MKKLFIFLLITCTFVFSQENKTMSGNKSFDPGNFSVSLAVKDIAASKAFYEKIGFRAFGGNQEQGWLIMKSDFAVIGLL